MSEIGQKHGKGGQENECIEETSHYFPHLVKTKLFWGFFALKKLLTPSLSWFPNTAPTWGGGAEHQKVAWGASKQGSTSS
jgi:hypothetical protein